MFTTDPEVALDLATTVESDSDEWLGVVTRISAGEYLGDGELEVVRQGQRLSDLTNGSDGALEADGGKT
jgi:hypothetical protein